MSCTENIQLHQSEDDSDGIRFFQVKNLARVPGMANQILISSSRNNLSLCQSVHLSPWESSSGEYSIPSSMASHDSVDGGSRPEITVENGLHAFSLLGDQIECT